MWYGAPGAEMSQTDKDEFVEIVFHVRTAGNIQANKEICKVTSDHEVCYEEHERGMLLTASGREGGGAAVVSTGGLEELDGDQTSQAEGRASAKTSSSAWKQDQERSGFLQT